MFLNFITYFYIILQVQVLTAASRDITSPMHRPNRLTEDDDINANPGDNEEDDDQHQPLIISDEDQERMPLTMVSYYEITDVTEMGRMASLFFNRIGKNLFYICIAIYLYGDLAIYGAAVSKSVRDVACTYRPVNQTSSLNISESEKCWEWSGQARMDVYRIVLAVFVCTMGQFVFCNVTKTKYLQIVTTIMR